MSADDPRPGDVLLVLVEPGEPTPDGWQRSPHSRTVIRRVYTGDEDDMPGPLIGFIRSALRGVRTPVAAAGLPGYDKSEGPR